MVHAAHPRSDTRTRVRAEGSGAAGAGTARIDGHDVHDVHDEHDVHDVHDRQGADDDDDENGDADDDEDQAEEFDRPRFVAQQRPAPTPLEGADLHIGVIGCGDVAQIVYLPHLSSLAGTTVTAIADRSRERVEGVGDRFGISHRYQHGTTLVTEHAADLDGVLVLSPLETRADLAGRALEAGLATFVETPLTVRPDDAWALLERVEQAGVPVVAAYPNRFDPAYHRYATELQGCEQICYVDAYHVTPTQPRLHETVHDPVAGSLPKQVSTESARIRSSQAKDAVGTDRSAIAAAYLSHLDRLCHDVNLLRDLFGDVSEIRHATLDEERGFLTAELGYEGGIRTHLTSGRTDRGWVEEYLRVDTVDRTARLALSNPLRSNAPSEVTVTQGTDEVLTHSHVPIAEDPFKRQLRAFTEAIRNGTGLRSSVADAAADVELIATLVGAGTGRADV